MGVDELSSEIAFDDLAAGVGLVQRGDDPRSTGNRSSMTMVSLRGQGFGAR